MAQLIRWASFGSRHNRFDESITLPRNSLNVSRTRPFVAKDCSEAADHYIETVMKVDVPVGPQPALDLFASNQLAWPLEQQTKQIDRLSAEPHLLPSSPQAPSAVVKLEVPERLHHGRTPFCPVVLQILRAEQVERRN
jgi:hypothetical protein